MSCGVYLFVWVLRLAVRDCLDVAVSNACFDIAVSNMFVWLDIAVGNAFVCLFGYCG